LVPGKSLREARNTHSYCCKGSLRRYSVVQMIGLAVPLKARCAGESLRELSTAEPRGLLGTWELCIGQSTAVQGFVKAHWAEDCLDRKAVDWKVPHHLSIASSRTGAGRYRFFWDCIGLGTDWSLVSWLCRCLDVS